MNAKKVLALSLILTLASVPVFGQQLGSVYISNVVGEVSTDALGVGHEIVWTLNLTNTSGQELVGSNNGFRVYSPDGAVWTPIAISQAGSAFSDAYTPANVFPYTAVTNTGTGADGDTVGIGGFSTAFPCQGFASGFDAPAITVRIPAPGIDSASHGKTICIDSSGYAVNFIWLWALCDGGGGEVHWGPVGSPYGGPVCYTVINPNAPPELEISVDSMHFNSIEGGANPDFQEFTVTAVSGQAVNFNLEEDSPWLIPTPITASTPRTIRVDINNLTLTTGSYIDTIEVQSAQAFNTPLYVVVTLDVEPPPPTISKTPNVFFFNAIANDTNPDPKTLTIKNVGGSVLNWTLTKSEAWLNLNPSSGVDSGDVEVSVDITGLTLGSYVDTIVITDPAANNNPQKVPVNLSVASDLPIIEVDSTFNYVVIQTGLGAADSTFITIRNGGAGTMDFSFEEHSVRILGFTPDSGTAPMDVKVLIRVVGVGDYFDTVWVHSNQAINSPVPVVFQLHYVANPANLVVSPPSQSYQLYECTQGVTGIPQILNFNVSNTGGDNLVDMTIDYESDLFTVFPLAGTAPAQFNIFTKNLVLPPGTYKDTIFINSIKNVSGPVPYEVTLNVVPGTQTPRIFLMDSVFTMTGQEDHGPILPQYFIIQNWYGGCMPWTLSESVPWLSVPDSSGNVVDTVLMFASSFGLTMGTYTDSFYITAPTASNTPRKIKTILKIWRFHGDYNYDGLVNIIDFTQMVNYMFRNSGKLPQPELLVGDVNCDDRMNIIDLNWLINYFYRLGPPICGNPSKKK